MSKLALDNFQTTKLKDIKPLYKTSALLNSASFSHSNSWSSLFCLKKQNYRKITSVCYESNSQTLRFAICTQEQQESNCPDLRYTSPTFFFHLRRVRLFSWRPKNRTTEDEESNSRQRGRYLISVYCLNRHDPALNLSKSQIQTSGFL